MRVERPESSILGRRVFDSAELSFLSQYRCHPERRAAESRGLLLVLTPLETLAGESGFLDSAVLRCYVEVK